MKRFGIILGILLVLQLSGCEGVQDLITDQRPQLGSLLVSSDRVMPLDTVVASITATNPIDGTLEYEWSAEPDRGYFLEPADKDSVFWVAPIQGGLYTLRVTVSNTKRSASQAKEVNVLNSTSPVVDVLKPQADAYFVLGQNITIEARANHANGISWVRAFVNDSLVGQSDQNASGVYSFNCIAAANKVGNPFITVKAEAANALAPVGSDSVQIKIGGIIPGKNEN